LPIQEENRVGKKRLKPSGTKTVDK